MTTPATGSSSTTTEILRELFTMAIEGGEPGVRTWATVLDYDPDACTARLVQVDEIPDGLITDFLRDVGERDAKIAELDAAGKLPPTIIHTVTTETIALGLRRLAAPVKNLGDKYRIKLAADVAVGGLDELDAVDADNILQAGVFNANVY